MRPSAQTISVAEGKSETMRGVCPFINFQLRFVRPMIYALSITLLLGFTFFLLPG
jgi:hypothetical protein